MPKRLIRRPVRICALPVDLINRTLGTELAKGDAWLSAVAHQHFAEDHADDYAICFSSLAEIIENPTWLGQAITHSANFELVSRIVGIDRIVLVAIRLQPNKYGNYNVVSVYCIKQETVDARRRSRRLVPTVKSPL